MARSQSGFTLVKAVIVVTIVAAALFALYIAFGYGYEKRAMVTEAIGEAAPMKERVMAYRQLMGKWPGMTDATTFRVEPSKLNRARSVSYDPAKHAVVITMEGSDALAGKRFAFYGEDGAQGPAWSCRTIDLETKHLPAACR